MFDLVADAKCQERVLAAEAPEPKALNKNVNIQRLYRFALQFHTCNNCLMHRNQLPEG